jgi:hypothetical protein
VLVRRGRLGYAAWEDASCCRELLETNNFATAIANSGACSMTAFAWATRAALAPTCPATFLIDCLVSKRSVATAIACCVRLFFKNNPYQRATGDGYPCRVPSAASCRAHLLQGIPAPRICHRRSYGLALWQLVGRCYSRGWGMSPVLPAHAWEPDSAPLSLRSDAGAFRVPPARVGSSSNATRGSHLQQCVRACVGQLP